MAGGSLTHSLLPILTDILILLHTIHSFSQFTHSSWNSFPQPVLLILSGCTDWGSVETFWPQAQESRNQGPSGWALSTFTS